MVHVYNSYFISILWALLPEWFTTVVEWWPAKVVNLNRICEINFPVLRASRNAFSDLLQQIFSFNKKSEIKTMKAVLPNSHLQEVQHGQDVRGPIRATKGIIFELLLFLVCKCCK